MYKFLSVFLICLTCSVRAGVSLEDNQPDEGKQFIYDNRFTVDNALLEFKKIEDSLEEYRQLTEQIRSNQKINLSAIKSSNWELQNLGFHNWLLSVKGTLLKQDYLLKKYKYESLPEKVSQNKAREEYRQSEVKLQLFLDNLKIAD
ncbi:MAG: hypothetical protein OEY89_06740 [Gammaproteobacteria bacterium]|nr:hypothetical protein [Gammaproteobacteria bacterium]